MVDTVRCLESFLCQKTERLDSFNHCNLVRLMTQEQVACQGASSWLTRISGLSQEGCRDEGQPPPEPATFWNGDWEPWEPPFALGTTARQTLQLAFDLPRNSKAGYTGRPVRDPLRGARWINSLSTPV